MCDSHSHTLTESTIGKKDSPSKLKVVSSRKRKESSISMSKNIKSAGALSKKSKTVNEAPLLKSQMAKKGKIGQTAQLLQNIRSGKGATVVDKAAVDNKDTEVAGPGKNIPNKIAVEHSSPASEDTLLGDKSSPKNPLS